MPRPSMVIGQSVADSLVAMIFGARARRNRVHRQLSKRAHTATNFRRVDRGRLERLPPDDNLDHPPTACSRATEHDPRLAAKRRDCVHGSRWRNQTPATACPRTSCVLPRLPTGAASLMWPADIPCPPHLLVSIPDDAAARPERRDQVAHERPAGRPRPSPLLLDISRQARGRHHSLDLAAAAKAGHELRDRRLRLGAARAGVQAGPGQRACKEAHCRSAGSAR